MNRREIVLGSVLIASAGLYFLLPVFSELGWRTQNPIQGLLARTSSKLASAHAQLEDLKQKQMQWETLLQNGLSGEPKVASLVYQEVLIDFLNQAGIQRPTISTGTPIPVEGLGNRIQFTLQLESTLPQLGCFLDRLECSNILHRTKLLSIQQLGTSNREHCSVSLILETLLIDGAVGSDINQLLSPHITTDYGTKLASRHAIGGPLPSEKPMFDLVSLFASESTTTAEKESEMEIDYTTTVETEMETDGDLYDARPSFQLVGIIGQGTERRAMILRTDTQSLLAIEAYDDLPNSNKSVEQAAIKIQDIETDFIQIIGSHGKRNVYIGEIL